jgi:DNA-binding beta-propeller fold protein YncE
LVHRPPSVFAALAIGVAVFGLSAATAFGGGPQPEDPSFGTRTKAKVAPGHYIVALKDSVANPEKLAENQVEQQDGKLGVIFSSALKGYGAKLSKDAVADLREDPRVRYVVPDYELQAQAQTIPTGIERILATKNPLADIDGTDDQRVNANVAVIDTGVDAAHPDLNVVSSVDCTSETNGGLLAPIGVSADAKGNIWVTDTEQHRVEEFNSKGEYLAQIGKFGTEPGKLINPWDVAVDAAGNVWVADTSNARIQEFEPSGKFLRTFGGWGSEPGTFGYPYGPRGIAVDAKGNVWVTGGGSYPLQKFTSKGEVLKTFSVGSKSGEFWNPAGITVDAKGNIWVADTTNNRIQELDSEGKFLFEFGKSGSGNGLLKFPQDVAFDAAGNIFVADSENYRVQKFEPNGKYLTQFGAKGSGPGQFGEGFSGGGPSGLAINSEGSIFVSDPVNSRVEKWSSASTPVFLQEFGWPGCIESPSAGTYESHATHVAGTIGAIDNSEGVAGVAPGARIWSVRALNRNGSGLLSWIAAGIDWVTATREDKDPNNDIEVANMSIGGFLPKTAAKPVDDAISGYEEGGKHIPGAVDEGVVVVVAAGNEGQAITEGEYEVMPAANPDAITVGALADTDGKAGGVGPGECYDDAGTVRRVNADDSLTWFTNWGPEVDIVAPGLCILSTWPGGGYESISGTSMATPHVTGAAALLASQSKPESKKDVEAIRNQLVEGGSLNFKYSKPSPAPLLYAGGTALSEPEAITGGFSGVTGLKATLQGGVQPRTKNVEYQFEIGTTTKYGKSWPASPKTINAGAGFTRVSQEVTGLLADTTYHYRLHATSGGKAIDGKDGEFTTLPFATTTAATNVEESEATLNGYADFSALPTKPTTTYEFEYGTTEAYGSKATAETSGTSFVKAYFNIFGKLQRTTVYHFRLVAKNEYGTFYGHDQRFRTAGWVRQEMSKAFKETWGPDSVSCVSATRCIGVEYGDDHAYAWNGETWSTSSVPAKSESLDVACASATACMAVGAGGKGVFAMWWDGKSWTDVSPTLASEAEQHGGKLEAVSCPAANQCFAVGQYWINNYVSTPPEYLLLRWDGKSWSKLAAPVVEPRPENAFTNLVHDISCPSTSECLAAGWVPLYWNGTKWSQVEAPAGFGHGGRVSCSGVGDCVAVRYVVEGYEVRGNAAMHWDGEEWTSLPPLGDVTTPDTQTVALKSISCPEAGSCSAVGWAERPKEGFSYATEPVAVRWDGSQWSNEYIAEGWRIFPTGEHEPTSVSCVPSGRCLAVGRSWTFATNNSPLVMTYNYSSPTAITDAATATGGGSAQLHATVNPNAYNTTYQLEYGETSTYGSKVPASALSIGAGHQNVQVSQTVTLPKTGASIHFRVVASNEKGTSYGEDLATPSAGTEAATSIEASKATLQGSVNPQGFSTGYRFEYVSEAAYNPKAENPYSAGSIVPAEPAQIGSGKTSSKVSQPITGLQSKTIYHYRLVAIGDGGTTYGEDQTFTTGRVDRPSFAFAFGSSGTGNGQFTNPRGIAIDSKGNAFVADYSSSTVSRIQKFNSKGEYVSQFGSWGTGNGQMKNLGGVAIDAEDNVYVLDFGNARIDKFNAKGEYVSQFKIPQTVEPNGIALDGKGNLWVLDSEEGLLKYSTAGQFLGKAGSTGSSDGQYSAPHEGIAADIDGNIWITDYGNKRIEKFNPRGEFLAKFGSSGSGDGQFNLGPRGIAIDPKGALWVADSGNNRIQEVVPEGEYISQFGSTGTGEGQFKTPTYTATDAEGRIWVIDSSNKRVEVLKQSAPAKAETTSATAINRNKATLNATVNPEGVATSYQFQYGTTSGYGSLAPASPKSIGSGSTRVKAAETILGLKPATTYYYRVVATSGATTSYGEDRHFTTAPVPSNPSVKWRIGGRSLAELGLSEASFATSGSFLMKIPGYGNAALECTEQGTGKITGTQGLEVKPALECAVAGSPKCTTGPITMTWNGTVNGSLAVEPKSIKFTIPHEGCLFSEGTWTFTLPSTIPMDVGTEALNLPASSSFQGTLNSGYTVYYTSLANWQLSGANAGLSFGYESGGPEVASQAASEVKTTLATLNGTVNPLGTLSTYFFEYGPTTSYGTTLPAEGGSAGSGTEALAKSQAISGLVPESTYHFRIVATNPKGIIYGKDLTFTTTANAAPSYQSSFGVVGSGNGQLKAPADVAIDASGNTWVVDKSNNRIQKFNAKGEYVSQFGTTGSGNGQFSRPTSIAIGPSGNLWVTDAGNNRVQKFSSAGAYLSQFGAKGTANGQFSEPEAITTDAKGNLWVCDTYNGRVEEFSEAGTFIQALGSKGSGAGQIGKCAGVDIGPAGKVWVADWEGNRVSVFSEAGAFLFSFGSEGTGVGQFKHPDGLEVDSKGNVWVGDEGNNRVQEFTQSGVYYAKFGSAGSEGGKFSLSSPIGIATDTLGNLWVTDSGSNRVQKWSIPGYVPSYQSSFGTLGSENGKLKAPADVAVDSSGNTWVVDKSNNRIQKFNAKGEYVSQFGTTGSGNGQFSRPTSIAIDYEGSLWVADAGNNRVQRFSSTGTYLSQFGTKGTGNGQFEEPEAITVNGELLYVCDTKNGRIQEFNEEGKFVRVIGSKGTGAGQFGKCTGIDTGPEGKVYAADWEGNRVNVFTSTGTFLFAFGSEGTGDGQFKHPDGVEIDSSGNVFVGDEGNNRVEQFNSSGEFITRFGSAGTGAGQFGFAAPLGIAVSNGSLWVTDPNNNRVQKWGYGP